MDRCWSVARGYRLRVARQYEVDQCSEKRSEMEQALVEMIRSDLSTFCTMRNQKNLPVDQKSFQSLKKAKIPSNGKLLCFMRSTTALWSMIYRKLLGVKERLMAGPTIASFFGGIALSVSRHLQAGSHQRSAPSREGALGMTHHVHLLDLTSFRDSNPAVNNVNDLLDPWAIAAKVIQDVPIIRDSSCPLLMFGGRAVAAMRMPPAVPARVIRLACALIAEVA
jgi:hypothetical protein